MSEPENRETGEPPVEVSVSFGFRGTTLEPDWVTQRLALAPTHRFRRGQLYVGRDGISRPRPWGVWQIRSNRSVVGSEEPSDHLSWMLSVLEPRAERIAEVRQAAEYADPRIWYESPQSNVISFALPSSLLTRACAMVDEVNFSMITCTDDVEWRR